MIRMEKKNETKVINKKNLAETRTYVSMCTRTFNNVYIGKTFKVVFSSWMI